MSNQLAEALRNLMELALNGESVLFTAEYDRARESLAAHEAAKPAEPWGYANRRDGQAWSRVVLEGWHAHNMARYDLPLYAAPVAVASPRKPPRLTDSQWVNIVNHANCYLDMSKDDAIALAVKLTEARMAANIKEQP